MMINPVNGNNQPFNGVTIPVSTKINVVGHSVFNNIYDLDQRHLKIVFNFLMIFW